MTDKEFKRLSRAQLIDIIYELQLEHKELTEENLKLKEELANKRIRLSQAGNIAEASLAIHNVMEAAQSAAEQYLAEIRIMKAETTEYCRMMVERAKIDAASIANRAQRQYSSYDSEVDAIMREFK